MSIATAILDSIASIIISSPLRYAPLNSKSLIGTSTQPLSYVINNAFKTLADSISIIKNYQSSEREDETLWDALNGEWFDNGSMEKLVSKVGGQLKTWCESDVKHKKNAICQVLTDDELKYGKY